MANNNVLIKAATSQEAKTNAIRILKCDSDGVLQVAVTGAATLTAAEVPLIVAKTVAATATPEKISATSKPFIKATFYGKKAVQGANNTTDAYFGTYSADGANGIVLPYGGEVTIEAPAGQYLDLTDFYLDVGTNGDGVVVSYFPYTP